MSSFTLSILNYLDQKLTRNDSRLIFVISHGVFNLQVCQEVYPRGGPRGSSEGEGEGMHLKDRRGSKDSLK